MSWRPFLVYIKLLELKRFVFNLSRQWRKCFCYRFYLRSTFIWFFVPFFFQTRLSRILLEIAQIAKKTDGPQYQLSFPVPLIKDTPSLPKGKLLVHRTQAFMIPKQEPAFRQSQLRSQSLSSMYEMRGDKLKPISYSNQPSSWESSAIQLPLASNFYWPDKEFSVCLWYLLEDNSSSRIQSQSGCDSPYKETKRHNYSTIKLISQQSHEAYGCEELYHLASFGGPNAMFEIWVGARTGYFQYRYEY